MATLRAYDSLLRQQSFCKSAGASERNRSSNDQGKYCLYPAALCGRRFCTSFGEGRGCNCFCELQTCEVHESNKAVAFGMRQCSCFVWRQTAADVALHFIAIYALCSFFRAALGSEYWSLPKWSAVVWAFCYRRYKNIYYKGTACAVEEQLCIHPEFALTVSHNSKQVEQIVYICTCIFFSLSTRRGKLCVNLSTGTQAALF